MSTVTLRSPGPRRPIVAVHPAKAPVAVAARLHLVPSADGWSLTQPDGELVHAAAGPGARRRCLEFARDSGVAALIS